MEGFTRALGQPVDSFPDWGGFLYGIVFSKEFFDNMLFMHEITWLLMQLKELIIPNICMLSYFMYTSIILYYFMLWS